MQGAVSEHVEALHRAADARGVDVEIVAVRSAGQLEGLHGLVLPGGESTAISRLLRSGRLEDPVRARGADGSLALFGTCAGLVLLSSEATHDVEDKGVHLLGLLDAEVDRNAFGRQRESFESALEVEGVGPVPAVFIRAPVLKRVWGGTAPLAEVRQGIVAARKGRVLGTSFHPELTADTALHGLFLDLAVQAATQDGGTKAHAEAA